MICKDLHKVGNQEYLLIYDTYNLEQPAYGPHLMLDIRGCDREKLASLEFCQKFLNDIPDKIGMTKILGPIALTYVCPTDPSENGVTGVTIIAESHITIHTYPEKDKAFIDIFSCKHFDYQRVTELTIQMFDARITDAFICKRGVESN